MSCGVQSVAPSRKIVSVNGKVIPRDAIARETQHHPSPRPAEAWQHAARALVIRELLLQEAERLQVDGEPITDDAGRRETSEEARVRLLLEKEVHTPLPDDETCRRYYDRNRQRFRTSDLYEAAHILLPAAPGDPTSLAKARLAAEGIIAALLEDPDRFEDLARSTSACPSAAQGGNLGQLGRGQTTPEFDQALASMQEGEITAAPVQSRYGLHVIRLERKIAGRELPFEAVRERIARYLSEAVTRRALAQYVAILAGRADVVGIEFQAPTGNLVQ
ncbi:MAG: peptidylprolyl isomerase [Alsobacter sp.]